MAVSANTFILVVAFYAINVQSECSFIEPVEKFGPIVSTKAYAVLRYENGKETTSSCIVYDVTPEGVTDTHFKQDGTNETYSGKFKRSKCDPGKLNAEGMIGSPNRRFVVYEDTEFDFIIFRACYENTDYLWVVSKKEKHPCKDALNKMYAVLKTMKLDGPQIYRSCFDSY